MSWPAVKPLSEMIWHCGSDSGGQQKGAMSQQGQPRQNATSTQVPSRAPNKPAAVPLSPSLASLDDMLAARAYSIYSLPLACTQ